MQIESIEIAGCKIEVARWGDRGGARLPILLLHEGLGSVRLWKDFPGLLAEATGREVIAWSRRGHGDSAGCELPHALDYMHIEAELLPAVHEVLGLKRAYWLGHSDGGSIALIGAAQHRDLVAGLILVAPHVFVEDLTVKSIAAIGESFAASGMSERMERYHAAPARVFSRWRDAWLDPRFRDWTIEPLLESIEAPALLIQGRDDQYGTMAQLDCIEAALGAVRRIELEACGHAPHAERHAEVIAAVCAFLAEDDGSYCRPIPARKVLP